MNHIKILAGSALAVSCLFAAIEPVTNLSLSTPYSDGLKHNGDVTYTWTPPSDENLSGYYYLFDTNSSNENVAASTDKLSLPGSATSVTITPPDNANADYYFHIVAKHNDGTTSGTKYTTAPAKVDKVKGTITSISPDGGTLTQMEDLTMSKSEDGVIYYTTDGTTPDYNSTSPTGTTQIYTTPLSIVTAKTVKARLKDTAGNKGDVLEKVFASTVQPTVKTTQDNTIITNNPTFATNSNAGATPNTSITIGSGDNTEGFTRFKYKTSSTATLSGDNDITATVDISTLNSGSYNYYVFGGDTYNYIDTADNSKAKLVSFTVDNDAPTNLTVSYDNNTTVTRINPSLVSQSGFVTFGATSASEIKYKVTNAILNNYVDFTESNTTALDLSNHVSTDAEASVTIKVAAKDLSGNWSQNSKIYIIDDKNPVVTMPDAKTFSTDFTTTISFDDDGNTSTLDNGSIKYTTVAQTTCGTKTIDELALTYSGSATITQSGASNICLYAASIDEVGNESSVSSVLFTYDSVASTLNLDLLDNKLFATEDTYGAIPITDINVSGSNFIIYGYAFDDLGETNSTEATGLINLTTLANGEHNVTVKAYKTGGVLGATEVRNFTIDNIAPTAFSSSDYNESTFITTSYALTLTKPNDADYIMYSEDNVSFTTSSASSVEITLTSTTTLYSKTKDTAGNMSAVYSATLTQDIPVQEFNLVAGWNMTVMPTGTIATAGLTDPVVWDYNGSSWSNNLDNGYTAIETTNISKGYWIQLASNTTVSFESDDTNVPNLSTVSYGWSLLGTTSDVDIVGLDTASIVWIYVDGMWKYNTTDSSLNSMLSGLGYSSINTIPAYSGFWIYKQNI